jgi:hypothetical protein
MKLITPMVAAMPGWPIARNTAHVRLCSCAAMSRTIIRPVGLGVEDGSSADGVLSAAEQRAITRSMARRLLQIVMYDKSCRIGATLTLDDLVDTSEVGDWKMPDFRAACSYAASQGWLVVQDDALTLTAAGLAAA